MDSQEMSDSMTAYVTQAWSMEGQLPLLVGIALLLGLGKGGVPGFATVATAATVATSPSNIPGGLSYAVALQVPILTLIDISAAWLHYKDLDTATIRLLLPMSFVGMALGVVIDKYLTDASARLLVGLLLLMILAVQLTKESLMAALENKSTTSNSSSKEDTPESQKEEHHHEDLEGGSTPVNYTSDGSGLHRRKHHESTTPNKSEAHKDNHEMDASIKKQSTSTNAPTRTAQLIWATVVGIVGGAATMLTNAMGPILNVYLLSVVQLSPSAYIGTRAMFFCFLNCGKLPLRFSNGTLGLQMMPLAGVLGVVSVVGVMAAKPIMLSMPAHVFVKLELAVVAFSGLRLCWMGLYG